MDSTMDFTDVQTKKWLCDEVQSLLWRVKELENELQAWRLQGKINLLPRVMYLEGRLRVLEGTRHDEEGDPDDDSFRCSEAAAAAAR